MLAEKGRQSAGANTSYISPYFKGTQDAPEWRSADWIQRFYNTLWDMPI